MAELSRRTVEPPELGELLEFAERPRDHDWCLRAALTRYAQPEPARVGALLDLVRRIEFTLDDHADELKRGGPAIWAALLEESPDPSGPDTDGDGYVVGVLRALREVDGLGDRLCSWAVAREGARPDDAVDAVVASLRSRLAELGVPEQERPGPPAGARARRASA